MVKEEARSSPVKPWSGRKPTVREVSHSAREGAAHPSSPAPERPYLVDGPVDGSGDYTFFLARGDPRISEILRFEKGHFGACTQLKVRRGDKQVMGRGQITRCF